MITHVRASGAGSVAAQLPRELAHSDSDTTIADITAAQDIPDLAPLSFTVATYPVYVTLIIPIVSSATNVSEALAAITDNANAVKAASYLDLAASESDSMIVVERISTPGPYVRKGRIFASGAGVCSLGLTATEIVQFMATERVPAL